MENQFVVYTDESKRKKTSVKIEMRSKPLNGYEYQLNEGSKTEKNINKREKPSTDVKNVSTSKQKGVGVAKEKHYKTEKKETSNAFKQGSRPNKSPINQPRVKQNEKYKKRFEEKYPRCLMEKENYPVFEKHNNQIKAREIFKPIDEYSIENKQSQITNRQLLENNQRRKKERASVKTRNQKENKAKEELISNFQRLYFNHSALVEAQNFLIHEETKRLQAKQLATHLRCIDKMQKLTNRAQILESKCHDLKKKKEKAVRNIIKEAEINRSAFQQYVTTL